MPFAHSNIQLTQGWESRDSKGLIFFKLIFKAWNWIDWQEQTIPWRAYRELLTYVKYGCAPLRKLELCFVIISHCAIECCTLVLSMWPLVVECSWSGLQRENVYKVTKTFFPVLTIPARDSVLSYRCSWWLCCIFIFPLHYFVLGEAEHKDGADQAEGLSCMLNCHVSAHSW